LVVVVVVLFAFSSAVRAPLCVAYHTNKDASYQVLIRQDSIQHRKA